MRFLQLTSKMSNCSKFSDDTFRWDLPNLEFTYDEKVALSHIVIDFVNKPANSSPIQVSTNLIDRDSYNPDGLIICFPSRSKDLVHYSPNFEFWKIDSIRPRQVLFTFRGIAIDTVSFVSIVLVIQ